MKRGEKAPEGTPPYHARIREFLLHEFSENRIPVAKDVAAAFGVSRPYVHAIRSALRSEGLLPVSPHGRDLRKLPADERLDIEANRRARLAMKAATKPLVDEIASAGREVGLTLGVASRPLAEWKAEREAFDIALSDGSLKAMTADQRRIFLSEVAKRTGRDEIKVSAIAALNRLDASLRTADDIGPRIPLTRDEALTRLRELRLAITTLFPS
jgi:hypothetical protein